MTDAYCGPSNALQSFKRHTQVDRSLQQDRLAGPRTPVQGFRSHDPRAGSLDADLHAFENAPPNPFQEPFLGASFAPQPQFQTPGASDWAQDFQQLRITGSPISAHEFRNHTPLVGSMNTNGWQNEFMRQEPDVQSSVSLGKQALYDQQQVPVYNQHMQLQRGLAPLTSYGTGVHQLPETSQPQKPDQILEADWSRAFEEAFQDAFQDVEQGQQADLGEKPLDVLENNLHKDAPSESILETGKIKIGSDAIDYVEAKDRAADHDQQDASALARVAGELLHNVQHDNSEKFQNSQFLDLMRKIRDRQVEVRNNDFESTTAGPSESAVQKSGSITDNELRTAPDPVQNQDTFLIPDMDPIYAPRHEDYIDYTFDSDQFPSQPRNQISDLHPGGKLYPEQSQPGTYNETGGTVAAGMPLSGSSTISAADFEAAYEQSHGLASRYRRPVA